MPSVFQVALAAANAKELGHVSGRGAGQKQQRDRESFDLSRHNLLALGNRYDDRLGSNSVWEDGTLKPSSFTAKTAIGLIRLSDCDIQRLVHVSSDDSTAHFGLVN